MKKITFLALLLSIVLTVSSQQTSQLVGKYTFNNGWTNEINTQQSGTPMSQLAGTAPALEVNTVRNSTVLHQYSGLEKDLTRSYTKFPNPLKTSNAISFTVSVWVNRFDDQPWDGLWAFLDGGNRFFLNPNTYLSYNANNQFFDCNWPARLTTSVVPVAEWSMVTVTVDASSFGIYLNGALIYDQNSCDWASNTTATGAAFDYSMVVDLVKTAPDFYFGFGSWWGSAQLLLDDLYIYKTALTSAEVRDLYKVFTDTKDIQFNKEIDIRYNKESSSINVLGLESGELIELINSAGQQVLKTNQSIISTSGLSKGIYVLKASKASKIICQKVAVL